MNFTGHIVCVAVMTLLLGAIFSYLAFAGVNLLPVLLRILAHGVGAFLGLVLLWLLVHAATAILKSRK